MLRLPWEASPRDLTGTLEPGRTPLVGDATSGVRVTATRRRGREQLHGQPPGPAWLPAGWVEPIDPHVLVERWRQAHP